MRSFCVLALAAGAAGHGWINMPPSRAGGEGMAKTGMSTGGAATVCDAWYHGPGVCLWFSQGCTIGCPKCGGVDGIDGNGDQCPGKQGVATLPKWARTYYRAGISDEACGLNPWCAPGSAPIMDPCGVAGGDKVPGRAGAGGSPPPGHRQGEHGSGLKKISVKTTWTTGSTVEVSWALNANHGGGYQYRLCPKGSKQTEDCFQKTPMPFVGSEQYIQYCPHPTHLPNGRPCPPHNCSILPSEYPACDASNQPRDTFKAVDISTGTIPAGSTWRRNPIPACLSPFGGAFDSQCGVRDGADGSQPGDYFFDPLGPDRLRPGQLLGGFGVGSCTSGVAGKNCTDKDYYNRMFQFSIVDKVLVPDVPPGDYVMSWRWDCEQTPQIWSSCADVTIKAGNPAPAAAKYGCFNNACAADPNGVPLDVCKSVCHQ